MLQRNKETALLSSAPEPGRREAGELGGDRIQTSGSQQTGSRWDLSTPLSSLSFSVSLSLSLTFSLLFFCHSLSFLTYLSFSLSLRVSFSLLVQRKDGTTGRDVRSSSAKRRGRRRASARGWDWNAELQGPGKVGGFRWARDGAAEEGGRR